MLTLKDFSVRLIRVLMWFLNINKMCQYLSSISDACAQG